MQNSSKNELNSEQKRAVEATKGPVLILAGAGAGKTKTLVERIRHLIQKGVAPSSILAITFTNKAAKEMRERIDKELREDKSINRPIESSERPFVSTFHALGVHILREQAHLLGLKRFFTIFDRDDSKKAVKEALVKADLDPKMHDPGRILSIISKEKGKGLTPETYEGEGRGYFAEVVQQIWTEYDKTLKREQALDFDDLLLKTRDLLRDHTDVRSYYTNIWKYVHIDEYQDTNRVQYEISKMIVGENKNICAVGDIDQNIYSWRGADIKNILDFEKDYPDAEVILLEENYRSTKTILEAANAVIEKNKLRRKKNLFTSNTDGEKISLFQGFDESSEAEFIAQKVEELIKSGTSPEDIAVLFRANFQSRILEESFMRHSLPYQMLGVRFFERKEVKDILSYLRAALNPESLSDMKRIMNVPARGIGKSSMAKILLGDESSLPSAMRNKLSHFRDLLKNIEVQAKTQLPSETIRYIVKHSGMEEEWKGRDEDQMRLENAQELASFASRYDHLPPEEGMLELLKDTALQSDQDELKEEVKSVRLMTVHSSKGLEFDIVFVAGLEDGLFPHQKSNEAGISPGESEEERRLFYVAITRARKKVYLSYAQTRTIFGRRQVNIPSEFIFDIPEEYTMEEGFDEERVPRRPLLEIDF